MDLIRPSTSDIFLLTPLREGRHGPRRWKKCRGGISTHAPAGGATHTVGRTTPEALISTHAPAGGATKFGGIPCMQ